jgi:hypothetical protein
MSIIDKIHEDEEEYEKLCEIMMVDRVRYCDNFYEHFEELKTQFKEQSEYDKRK